jgi:hypothetical protein
MPLVNYFLFFLPSSQKVVGTIDGIWLGLELVVGLGLALGLWVFALIPGCPFAFVRRSDRINGVNFMACVCGVLSITLFGWFE